MKTNELQLWCGKVSAITARPEYLSPEEHVQAQRYATPARQELHVAARTALRILLATALNTEPWKVAINIDEKGKPFVEGSSVHFNISHSGDVILIGISKGRVLGVDTEQINPKRPLERLAERFYHEEEKAELKARPSTKTFFEIWTRKEAYLKLEGGGIDRELSSFSVWKTTPAGIYLATIEAPEGYCAAIALQGTSAPTITRPSLP